MRNRRFSPIHFLDTDGVIACKGMDLATAARRQDQSPPYITIHYSDVTCDVCRRWFVSHKLAS